MNAAQVAWVFLTTAFLAAGTLLLLLDEKFIGSVLITLASFGYVLFSAMIVTDASGRASSG